MLGEGGFGKVYKGWLDEKTPGKAGSGTVIAVKKLNNESKQGFQEWQVKFSCRKEMNSDSRLISCCGEFCVTYTFDLLIISNLFLINIILLLG